MVERSVVCSRYCVKFWHIPYPHHRADFHEIEDYSGPKDIPSGEAFRMLRMCQLHHRPDDEQWWWRGISNSITKDVKQLLNKEVIMKEVDRSLLVPIFWLPVKLGVFRRLNGIKCDEVIPAIPTSERSANSKRKLLNMSNI